MFTKSLDFLRTVSSHQAQCLALSHSQHILGPSLFAKGGLVPCLALAIPNVLSVFLTLSGAFPCSSPHTLPQSLSQPPYSTPSSHCQEKNKKQRRR